MLNTLQTFTVIPLYLASILGGDNHDLLNPFSKEQIVAEREMSLQNRYADQWVNNVFKDNILLTLAYLNNSVTSKSDINWDDVTKSSVFEFRLEPGQTFAYHDDVDQKYKDSLVKTTNAHFNSTDGFKSSGLLFGDGVCHLASLIYWAASDAGLATQVPTNHNFANIPDIPKEFGVSIYSNPYAKGSNTRQNLYITNNKEKPIAFKFEYNDQKVKVSVIEVN